MTETFMTDTDPHDHIHIEWLNATDWVSAPAQSRSRKSLQKILSTAWELFVRDGYDETTITQISKQSGISVGSIYHRFPDKLSILYAVLESYRRTRFAQVEALAREDAWHGKTAADVLNFHIEVIFSSTRADTGIMRLIERQRIVNPAIEEMQIAWSEHFCDVMTSLYRPHADCIRHPDLKKAVHYIQYIIRGSTLWSILSSPSGSDALDIHSEEYRQEAYKMAESYLGLTGAR